MPSRPPRPTWPAGRRAAMALALVLVVSAAALPACSSLPDEICDARCDCTGCTDIEREACLVDVTAEADTAEAYGCEEPYEASADCALTRSRCRDGRFFLDGFDCAAEAAELSECKVRGSSLD